MKKNKSEENGSYYPTPFSSPCYEYWSNEKKCFIKGKFISPILFCRTFHYWLSGSFIMCFFLLLLLFILHFPLNNENINIFLFLFHVIYIVIYAIIGIHLCRIQYYFNARKQIRVEKIKCKYEKLFYKKCIFCAIIIQIINILFALLYIYYVAITDNFNMQTSTKIFLFIILVILFLLAEIIVIFFIFEARKQIREKKLLIIK